MSVNRPSLVMSHYLLGSFIACVYCYINGGVYNKTLKVDICL